MRELRSAWTRDRCEGSPDLKRNGEGKKKVRRSILALIKSLYELLIEGRRSWEEKKAGSRPNAFLQDLHHATMKYRAIRAGRPNALGPALLQFLNEKEKGGAGGTQAGQRNSSIAITKGRDLKSRLQTTELEPCNAADPGEKRNALNSKEGHVQGRVTNETAG